MLLQVAENFLAAKWSYWLLTGPVLVFLLQVLVWTYTGGYPPRSDPPRGPLALLPRDRHLECASPAFKAIDPSSLRVCTICSVQKRLGVKESVCKRICV